MKPHDSISGRLQSVIVLTTGSVLVLACALFIFFEWRNSLADEKRTALSRARITADACSGMLAFRNPAEAEQLLRAFHSDPDVLVASLHDRDGSLFAGYHSAGAGPPIPLPPRADGLHVDRARLSVLQPVTQGERRFGTLFLQMGLGRIYARLARETWVALLTFAVALAGAYSIGQVLQRDVSRPILVLADTAQSISRDRDYTVRAQPAKGGELELLTTAFNQMLEEIQRQQQALAREKQLLATTLASIGDAVIVTDPEGRITFLNSEAERLTGWGSTDASGRPLLEVFRIVNEETRQPVENPVDKVLRHGNVVGLANHTLLLAKSGAEIAIDDSAAPIRERGGFLHGVVLVFRDFTEHKQNEKKLQELSLLPAQNPAPVLRVSEQGTLLFANPAALKRFGGWNLAVGERAPAQVCSLAAEALKAHQPADRELSVGARTYVVSVVPIIEFAYANLYCTDVTERKRAEEALRAREAELEIIINRTPFMLTRCSRDLRYRFVSQAYADMLGRRPSDVVGKPICDIMGEEGFSTILPHIERVLKGDTEEYERSVHFRDVGVRFLHVTYTPERDERGEVTGWLASILDVTSRRQAEQALQDAHAQLADRALHLEKIVGDRTAKLKEMVNELQHVSYAIVHDMRAPLRAMNTFAGEILDHISADVQSPPQIQDFCRRIIIASRRLDRLIQDSLSYTKTVLQEVPLQPVDLSRLIPSLIETYPNLQADKADITIENPLPVVLGEESLLTQCFSNLLGNAVKFVAPGVRPHIRLRCQMSNSFARVTVEDNGIGITRQAQPRLFGMFQRLTAEYEGTGIGLAIVRKVAERMGGRVGADSEPGKGSRFWVELRTADGAGRSGVPTSTDAAQL
jgi:PAS domain S-box-containing protein